MAYPLRLAAGRLATQRMMQWRYNVKGLMMTEANSSIGDDTLPPADRGTGFLFWGWRGVTLLNLGMVGVAWAIFAP